MAMKYTKKPLVDRETLRPRKALWDDEIFQSWVAEIEEELNALEAAGIAVPIGGSANSAQAMALKYIGMDAPVTHEDSLRVYLSLRGVVHFWRRKLGQLKSESEKFTQLEKKLNESQTGTADDVTRRGSGISRFQPGR
jgi:hypothetical protein